MKKVLELYKPIGKTPLEEIQQFQKENPQYHGIKLAYAGRLDPMAEGLLLVLVGEECKKRKEYEELPKTYEFEVLFGISTDTFDVMGKILKLEVLNSSKFLFTLSEAEGRKLEQQKEKIYKKYKGEILQEYPPYSSPRVNGKSLFWWAREGKLSEIKIPEKLIIIYDLRPASPAGGFMNEYQISAKQLLKTVHERIGKVNGEFRQKEILGLWDEKLKGKNYKFPVLKFKIECSSGTYVRSIANSIGYDLGIGAIAFSIKRTSVGKYKLNEVIDN